MKEWTEEARDALAEKLMDIQLFLESLTDEYDVGDELIRALDDAIDLISPGFTEKLDRELEEAISQPDPEADEFVRRVMDSPEARAFIADIEARRNGDNVVDISGIRGKKD